MRLTSFFPLFFLLPLVLLQVLAAPMLPALAQTSVAVRPNAAPAVPDLDRWRAVFVELWCAWLGPTGSGGSGGSGGAMPGSCGQDAHVLALQFCHALASHLDMLPFLTRDVCGGKFLARALTPARNVALDPALFEFVPMPTSAHGQAASQPPQPQPQPQPVLAVPDAPPLDAQFVLQQMVQARLQGHWGVSPWAMNSLAVFDFDVTQPPMLPAAKVHLDAVSFPSAADWHGLVHDQVWPLEAGITPAADEQLLARCDRYNHLETSSTPPPPPPPFSSRGCLSLFFCFSCFCLRAQVGLVGRRDWRRGRRGRVPHSGHLGLAVQSSPCARAAPVVAGDSAGLPLARQH